MVTVIGQTAQHTLFNPTLSVPKRPLAPLTPKTQRHLEEARLASQLRLEWSAQRKAHARQMVERIKDQIDKLGLLGLVEPRVRAHAIKMLARQLSAAAREYASAGNPTEIRAEADRVEAKAREIEGREETSDQAAARAAATQAALSAERQGDEDFVRTVATMRRTLETLFQHAADQAIDVEKDRDEVEDLIKNFVETRDEIIAAEDTITGWWRGVPAVALTA